MSTPSDASNPPSFDLPAAYGNVPRTKVNEALWAVHHPAFLQKMVDELCDNLRATTTKTWRDPMDGRLNQSARRDPGMVVMMSPTLHAQMREIMTAQQAPYPVSAPGTTEHHASPNGRSVPVPVTLQPWLVMTPGPSWQQFMAATHASGDVCLAIDNRLTLVHNILATQRTTQELSAEQTGQILLKAINTELAWLNRPTLDTLPAWVGADEATVAESAQVQPSSDIQRPC